MPAAEPKDDPPPDPSADALLCYCMHVTERTIAEAIANGARELEALMARTGAGRGCGTCRFDLIERLRAAAAAAADQANERCSDR
ncbi:MAG: (2Fe-2S)-binding protein [Planctomycetota bacterium]